MIHTLRHDITDIGHYANIIIIDVDINTPITVSSFTPRHYY
jgi:hypothetical protein